MRIDEWPSTPIKAITVWAMSLIFFVVSLIIILRNMTINDAVYFTLAGIVFGHDAVATVQFIGKRKTAWEPAVTESEVDQPPVGGQPPNIAGGA